MKFVQAYNTFSSADANLVCSALRSAGIEAEVTNELSSLSLDGYALASGGIRVMVPEEKLSEARALIEQTQNAGSDEEPR